MSTNERNPVARTEGILTQKTFEDFVVVDQGRNAAHTLNKTAALIFENADGTRSIDDLIALLQQNLNEAADRDLVELTLDQLDRAHLLADRAPRASDLKRESRRRFVQKVGLMGTLTMLLPTVESIASPTTRDSQSPTSCKSGQSCSSCASCKSCQACQTCQTCRTCQSCQSCQGDLKKKKKDSKKKDFKKKDSKKKDSKKKSNNNKRGRR